jgi:hypothetical protein
LSAEPRPAAPSPEIVERVMLSRAFSRLDPVALGVAVGGVCGVGLAVATAVLLLQGGVFVGLHLQRLAYYLPGYSVSWSGAGVGLVEAGLLGAALGASLAWIWNAYHRMFVALVVWRERARDRRRELQEL